MDGTDELDRLHGCPSREVVARMKAISVVSLSRVRITDATLLFAWQQHPSTRVYSRVRDAPTWEDHLIWLSSYLQREEVYFFLICNGEHPVGFLRLDRVLGDLEVSIAIAPGLRQRGFAYEALCLIKDYTPERLLAYIKPDNEASLALFKKAGFRPMRDHSCGDMYVYSR